MCLYNLAVWRGNAVCVSLLTKEGFYLVVKVVFESHERH